MKSHFAIAVLFAALCLGAVPARAFTESGDGSYAYPDSTPKFSDPDEQFDDAGSKAPGSTLKFGDGGALHFGLQPQDSAGDNTDPRSALTH